MFRIVSAYLLIAGVLFSTVGVTFRKHTCHTRAITSTYLISSPIHCCKEKKEEKLSCCEKKQQKVKKGCCSFESEYHYLNTPRKLSGSIELSFIPHVQIITVTEAPALLSGYAEGFSLRMKAPPPGRTFPILLQSCNFRI